MESPTLSFKFARGQVPSRIMNFKTKKDHTVDMSLAGSRICKTAYRDRVFRRFGENKRVAPFAGSMKEWGTDVLVDKNCG